MSNELKAMTDGTFTFAESEDPNVFYFYRNDGEVIGNVGRMPMDFYQNWICTKMFNGEITEMVMNDICFETSDDDKCIRLTVSGIGERKSKQEQPNFIKRLFSKLFKKSLAVCKCGMFMKSKCITFFY